MSRTAETNEIHDRHTPARQPAPKSGARVQLKVNVEENSGGHSHHDDNRPKGSVSGLSGVAACAAPDNAAHCVTATTNTEGYANFTFTSTPVSGTHTFTAACISPACNNQDTGKIDVKVDGLQPIPGSMYYSFKSPNSDTNHPNTFFLKPEFSSKLENIAMFYHWNTYYQSKQGVIPDFVLTEGSLKWGGVLDCFLTCNTAQYPSTPWNKYHDEHRRGSVVDVRANGTPGSVVYVKQFRDAAKFYKVDIGNLHGSGDGLHYHLRLNNNAKE